MPLFHQYLARITPQHFSPTRCVRPEFPRSRYRLGHNCLRLLHLDAEQPGILYYLRLD